MIRVSLFRNDGELSGFSVIGHAGYADTGYDIICAAVSVLAVNTVNSIETFTDDKMDINEGDGVIEVAFFDTPSERAKLLIDSFILGIRGVIEQYGSEYIRLEEH